ncbi:long-chain fatty acid transport protein 4-like isoform X1 [Tachypleus tridentatus]|uniref:long-chain fatty acid transport protein 4-like isoform X1 n=1 Tax=Tachypleus tridentatus TaxID=6853 RepID=UPI003FD56503
MERKWYFGGFVLMWLARGSLLEALVTTFAFYVATGGWRFLQVFYNTFSRDVKAIFMVLKVKHYLSVIQGGNQSVPDLFRLQVQKNPNKVCFYYGDQKWTFKEMEEFSNRVANCFQKFGYTSGDEVALFMESRPEFVGIWLGLAKIGVVTAFINTNLRMHSLLHSLSINKCNAIICGSDCLEAIKDVAPLLAAKKNEVTIFYFGDNLNNNFPVKSLNDLLLSACSLPPDVNCKLNFHDRLLYIYTSGTSGLPKAAIVKNSRFLWITIGYHWTLGMKDDDIIYNCLPLYHTAGGILVIGQALIFGNSVVIRSKFSASKFWEDCVKYNCTVAQYIGEICRYLLAQPERPIDKQHKIRVMAGNGLRIHIWEKFKTRFNLERIYEYFGSTEGTASLINIDGKVGSVGFISQIFGTFYPVILVRVDPDTAEPLRDKDGLCITCKPGEPGQVVGRVYSNDPIRQFDGYVDQSETKKKIIKDILKKGDAGYLTGDIVVMDEYGYVYFKDRTGDTYRWKGENVSTTEVESVISKILGQTDCVVYGVQIPGTEGRAGMAALPDPERKIDMKELLSELERQLPSYAVPYFIRLVDRIEVTGTYKLRKIDLQKEGFDIHRIPDFIYYWDKKVKCYLPMDENTYQLIQSGSLRL